VELDLLALQRWERGGRSARRLLLACAGCVERLGIRAHESAAWRDGGAKVDPTVTVRFVEPESDDRWDELERDELEPPLDYSMPYGAVRAKQLARAAREAVAREADARAARGVVALEAYRRTRARGPVSSPTST
jgi:hypothetical protein